MSCAGTENLLLVWPGVTHKLFPYTIQVCQQRIIDSSALYTSPNGNLNVGFGTNLSVGFGNQPKGPLFPAAGTPQNLHNMTQAG